MSKHCELNKKFNISKEYEIVHFSKGFKPLCFVQDKILTYRKGKIYLLNIKGFIYDYICNFYDNKPFDKLLTNFRLITRLLRLEPRTAMEISDSNIVLSFRGKLYLINLDEKKIKEIHKFREGMNNPLNMCTIKNLKNFDNMYCYGEYFSNPMKNEVCIYRSITGISKWEKIFTFSEGKINHIHAIVPDYYRNKVWILTGDTGNGAGIWYTDDNFKTIEEFLIGSQMYRSCAAFPTSEGLIYATDTPLEYNSIFMLNLEENSYKKEKLYDLGGSCIYSTKIGNEMVFSTTVEGDSSLNRGKFNLISYKKGKGIKSWNSEVIVGNESSGFKSIARFKKDILPMGLFQFGTVMFPNGKSSNNYIVLYGCSLKGIDGKMMIFKKNNTN